jgi:transaldolase
MSIETKEVRMSENPLLELQKLGQSIWYDNIRRGLIVHGEIERMIAEDGVSGITSNPAIFNKAIAQSDDYDAALPPLFDRYERAVDVYEALAIEDVRSAARLLRPVYDRTQGIDGYVSIEVSPLLAQDTKGTIVEARRLFAAIGEPNVCIKVPATPQGLPAVTQLIGEGVNVNVTLIFALSVYRQVAEAYVAGLERLDAAGKALDGVASVASFFVSRIDTLVDKQLQAQIDAGTQLEALLGKAAIASAKLIYQIFKQVFATERFLSLKAKGARVQRPLWASTSTKNPAYSDVRYVEHLIGPHTVNTIPPATLAAFRDHGLVAATVETDTAEAQAVLEELAAAGVDMEQVTQALLEQGVQAFADAFVALLKAIDEKRAAVRQA